MNNEITLREWTNATRFPRSKYDCPNCHEPALEDTWPPNYFTANSTMSADFGESESESWGSVKHVCKQCCIAFRVGWSEKRENGKLVEDETIYSETTPLEKRDDIWLTPHDVWREDYKEEHGEYPAESYG